MPIEEKKPIQWFRIYSSSNEYDRIHQKWKSRRKNLKTASNRWNHINVIQCIHFNKHIDLNRFWNEEKKKTELALWILLIFFLSLCQTGTIKLEFFFVFIKRRRKRRKQIVQCLKMDDEIRATGSMPIRKNKRMKGKVKTQFGECFAEKKKDSMKKATKLEISFYSNGLNSTDVFLFRIVKDDRQLVESVSKYLIQNLFFLLCFCHFHFVCFLSSSSSSALVPWQYPTSVAVLIFVLFFCSSVDLHWWVGKPQNSFFL